MTGLFRTTSTGAGCEPVTSINAPKPVSMITGMSCFTCLMKRGLIATHLRHHPIEDDEVEVIALKFFQGLAPARRRRDRMPIATEIGRDDLQNPRLVIDDENV